MKTGYDKDHKPVFATGVFVDPVSKSLHVITDNGPQTYQGKGVRRFIKNVANYNGVTNDKADKILNNYMDMSGNYTGKQDTKAIAALSGEQDLKIRNKNKAAEPIRNAALAYQKSDNPEDVKKAVGHTLTDGSTISNIVAPDNGWWSKYIYSNPYQIVIKNGEKEETKNFKNAYDLGQFILDNTKVKK